MNTRPLQHHRRVYLARHLICLVALVVLGCSEPAEPPANTTTVFSKVLELRGEQISKLTARPISEIGNPRWKTNNPNESGVFFLKVVWQGEVEKTYSKISPHWVDVSIPFDYKFDVFGTPGTLSGSLVDDYWIAEKTNHGFLAAAVFREKLPSDEEIIACESREQFVDLLGKPKSIGGLRWVLFSITDHQTLNLLRVQLGGGGLTIHRGTATPLPIHRDTGNSE